MLSRLFRFLTAAVIFGLAWNTFVEASEQGLPQATRAPVGGEASIPYGWVDFCNRHSEECTLGKLKPMDVRLTRQSWKTLNEINNKVNNAIEPISNLDHWGTTLDHWDYPVDGKGDCKIYALFKRKLLIERGFPRQALLMTIVRDLNGEGHAVLTVKTDHGDFVLDNLSDEIRAVERHRLPVLQAPGPGRPERVAQSRRRDRVRAGNGRVELERGPIRTSSSALSQERWDKGSECSRNFVAMRRRLPLKSGQCESEKSTISCQAGWRLLSFFRKTEKHQLALPVGRTRPRHRRQGQGMTRCERCETKWPLNH